MGIQDLHQWIKKTHSHVLVSIHKRWADPRLAGKRVAIDGTLLTNQFFLSPKNAREGLEGKGAIIGWYQLITDMRAHGVQPVAIWDQRGPRTWKAAEARKRLSIRNQQLARRNQEEDRYHRLALVRDAFEDYSRMNPLERNLFHDHWASMLVEELPSSVSLPPPAPTRSSKPKLESAKSLPPPSTPPLFTRKDEHGQLPNTPSIKEVQASDHLSEEEAQVSLDKARSLADSVSEILLDYREHHKPFAVNRSGPSREDLLALDHVASLESMSGESAEGGGISEPLPSDDGDEPLRKEDNVIDETLQAIGPSESFTESRNQTGLTWSEGRLLQSFLLTPPDYVPGEGEPPVVEPRPLPPAIPEKETATKRKKKAEPEPVEPLPVELLTQGERFTRLEGLKSDSEEIQTMYAKGLALPTKREHEQCRELLLKMGVPILEAAIPYEAEGLASSLAKQGLVDFVATEDSDVLAYEGPLLRGVSGSGPFVYVSGERLRVELALSPSSFLDFCILLGTDASERIPGVGPVNSFKLISKYGSIESILENEAKVKAKIPDYEEFVKMLKDAREVFQTLPPIDKGWVLEQGVWDEETLNDWLAEEHGLEFDEYEVDEGYVLEEKDGAGAGERAPLKAETGARFEEIGDDVPWDEVLQDEKRAR